MAITKVSASLVDLDGGVVINESSADADFRVESNGKTHMLFVDGGNDRVGINGTGTNARGGSNTVALFDVSGSGKNYVEIQGATDSTANGLLFSDGSSGNYGVLGYDHANDVMNFFTAGAERMRIDSSGLVGIGQTPSSSDGSMLQITGNDGIQLKRSGQTNGFVIRPNASTDGLRFTQAGTGDRITIDNSGVVDITGGTLQLGSGANRRLIYRSANNDVLLEAASGLFYQQSIGSTYHAWFTGNSERMRIDSSGNVLVGTTSEVDSNCTALHTKATASTNWVQAMSGVDRGMVVYSTLTSGTTLFHYFIYNGSVVGSISSTGSSTAYNTSSDYRLKENVTDMTDATTRLKQLKPKRFNFKSDETNTLVDGFLAHEVSGIVPEAITGEKDAVDSEGNPEYQGIDQSKLVPLLVKTIQELEARITTLEG